MKALNAFKQYLALSSKLYVKDFKTMQIAILGASSQIAKGLIKVFAKQGNHHLRKRCIEDYIFREQHVFNDLIMQHDIIGKQVNQ